MTESVFTRTRILTLAATLLVAAFLVAFATAGAATGRPTKLWATINVCDSANARLGVRGQMPGDGTTEKMYMRFIAEYDTSNGWHAVSGGRSSWRAAGSARFRVQQTGWTFTLTPPAHGSSYVLRGYVEFQWRARRNGHTVVVRQTHAVTQAGHPHTVDAQPPNFSAATCRIAA